MTRLRTSMRWLTHKGTGAVVAQTTLTRILLLGINFATGVVIARLLGPAGRGQLSALVIWPPLMASLFTFGLPSALLYYARTSERHRTALFTIAMLLTAAFSVVMIGAGILILPHMLVQYDADTVHAAQLFMLLAPEIMLTYTLAAFMQASNRFAQFNQQRFLPAVLTLIGLVGVSIFGTLTPLTAAICYLAPPIPVFLYTLWCVRDIVGLSFAGARDEASRLLRYGAKACGIDILGTVSQQADQMMVVGLLSAASMGLYTVALSISRVPYLVFNAMSDVITSRAIGMPPEELTAIVGRATRLTAIGGTLFALAIAAVLPFVLPLFYGTGFRGAVLITDILLVEIVASGIASILAVAFLATGRPGTVTLVRGGSLIVVVPLLFVLIPRFALVGAASAILISSVARVIAFALLYRSSIGTAAPSLVPTLDDLRFLVHRLQRPHSPATVLIA
jgi:O-antigen/teichoic acid export membrane protein